VLPVLRPHGAAAGRGGGRYETLSACGAPVDKIARAGGGGGGGGGVYTRRYARCVVTVNCTVSAACEARIDGPYRKQAQGFLTSDTHTLSS
jgi:hypothetical protein